MVKVIIIWIVLAVVLLITNYYWHKGDSDD
jgi:hypothetical protein